LACRAPKIVLHGPKTRSKPHFAKFSYRARKASGRWAHDMSVRQLPAAPPKNCGPGILPALGASVPSADGSAQSGGRFELAKSAMRSPALRVERENFIVLCGNDQLALARSRAAPKQRLRIALALKSGMERGVKTES
jgi:hypothetical protein